MEDVMKWVEMRVGIIIAAERYINLLEFFWHRASDNYN